MRYGWLLAGVMAALVLAGCSKTTQVMVVNDTGLDAQVSLQGPGTITPAPPVLPVANGGKGSFKVETPTGKLPADYQWQGAERTGTVVIGADSPDQVIFNLSTGKPATSKVTVEPGKSTSVKVTP